LLSKTSIKSRLRVCVLPALVLLPLVLICGKLLLTPLSRMIDDPDMARKYGIIDAGAPPAAVRGWPWVFLKTVTYGWPPQTAPTDIIYFSWWRLLADVAVMSLVLIAAAALLAWHRRRRGAWLRFSLREMFALTAAVAIALSWWTFHRIQHGHEQNAAAFLSAKGCWVEFLPVTDCAPEWLQRLLPEDRLTIFQRAGTFVKTPKLTSRGDFNWLSAAVGRLPCVAYVEFGGNSPPYGSAERGKIPDTAGFDTANPAAFAHISHIGFSGIAIADDLVDWLGPLPSLREFRTYDSLITDRSLEQVSRWQALEHLEFYGPPLRGSREGGAKITDAGVEFLSRLPNLREIYLQSLDITDAAGETISRMPSLETVGLRYCSGVTDAALFPLSKLPQLRHLDVCGSKVTDAGIETILKLKDLQILELYECSNLSEAALRRLTELPNLTQVNLPTSAKVSEETLEELKAHIKSVYVD